MATQSIYKSQAGGEEILAFYNQILNRWPLPSKHVNIPTSYGNTFVIESGNPSGDPVVLLHGTASNSASWMGDVATYGKQFHVYAVDMPGEPGNSDSARFSWAGPAFHLWLDEVLNGLALEKVILIGMSLGAWTAVDYALYQPDRIKQTVLIVPSGISQPRASFVFRFIFFSLTGAWGRRRLKQFIFNGAELGEEVSRFLDLVDQHFYYRTGAPPLFTDIQLQSLAMPVLFLAGRQDALLNTSKTAERLKKCVPDLTMKIYEADGHATINTSGYVVDFINKK